MKIRYYCFNSDCPVTELRMDSSVDAECPCCKRSVVDADDHDEQVREEIEQGRIQDEEDRRIYGCPYEDMESMNYRPQVITNEDGEPIGWG